MKKQRRDGKISPVGSLNFNDIHVYGLYLHKFLFLSLFSVVVDRKKVKHKGISLNIEI